MNTILNFMKNGILNCKNLGFRKKRNFFGINPSFLKLVKMEY